MGNIHVTFFKLEPVVKEEMLFKEKVYGRCTEARRTKTNHNSSGELKNK